MGLQFGPKIVTNGLILALDASDVNSYPGSGTIWYDLSGKTAHGTLNGTVSFTGSGAKSYMNFPTSATTNYISSTVSQSYLDFTIVFRPDFTLSTTSTLVGLIGSSTDAANADKSLRLNNANGVGPWGVPNPGNTDDWASTATTYYLNNQAYTGVGSLASGWNILGGKRTNTTTGSFANPFAYFLGTEGYSGDVRGFKGQIAACYMYNRALTATEQTQNYNALKSRFGLS